MDVAKPKRYNNDNHTLNGNFITTHRDKQILENLLEKY